MFAHKKLEPMDRAMKLNRLFQRNKSGYGDVKKSEPQDLGNYIETLLSKRLTVQNNRRKNRFFYSSSTWEVTIIEQKKLNEKRKENNKYLNLSVSSDNCENSLPMHVKGISSRFLRGAHSFMINQRP